MRKEVFAWSLYDLANTAFSALFVTFFFPVLIKNHLGGNEFQLGLSLGISMFIAGLLVPVLGAASDKTGRRIPYVIFFTIIAIACMLITTYSNLLWALIFGLLANLGFHAALDVYDAKLADISTKKNVGKISGIGTAFGYVGTILSLVMAYLILGRFGFDSLEGIKIVFIGTGIFYFVFSLPLFFVLKDRIINGETGFRLFRDSFLSVKNTFTHIKQYRNVFLFLISSLLFVDGMETAIIYLYLFGQQQLGITVQNFFFLFGLMSVAAALGAWVFGHLTDRFGPKKTLAGILFAWLIILSLLFFKTNITTYVLVGSIGGALLGGIWTATRPMLLSIAPRHKIAELLGFQGLTEKFGGVFGPIAFGFVVVRAGYRPALLVLLAFIGLGLLFLLKVSSKRQVIAS